MKYLKVIMPALVFAMAGVYAAMHSARPDLVYVLRNFAAAALLILAYLAFGVKLQKILKLGAAAIKYPLAFTLSAGAMGMLFFIAGAAGFYNMVFAYAVLAAMAVFSYGEIKEIILDAGSSLKGLEKARLAPAGAVYYAAAGFVFIYLFFTCLTPPVYYDTLVYHMAVPEQYIQAGRLINMRENVFSFFPQLMQMNCLFFLLVSDELSVKLLYFFMAIMSAAALSGMAGELKADKKISVLLLAACPLFFLNASRVGAELPLMLFTTLLLYMLIKGSRSGFKRGDGLMAGLIAGMIIAVKYTGITVYAFGAVIFLYALFKKKAGIKGLAAYLLVPACVVLPYLIKNYFYAGAPLYPFLSGPFGIEAGLKADAAVYLAHVGGFGLPHTFLNLLASPFAAVYNEKLFGGDVLSPLFLAAFALLPLTDIRKTGLPALFMAFYFIAWFFTGQVLRFLLPVIPAAAVIAGCAYANAGSKLKYAAFGLLIAVQAFSSLYFGEKYLNPFRLFVSDREEYISGNVSYYKAAEFINKNTEQGARVLVMGDARASYIKRPVLAYTVFNARTVFEGLKEAGEEKITSGFRLRGIRYMLVNWTEMGRLRAAGYGDVAALAGDPGFKNIMDKYFKKIYSDDDCDVYAFTGRQ